MLKSYKDVNDCSCKLLSASTYIYFHVNLSSLISGVDWDALQDTVSDGT